MFLASRNPTYFCMFPVHPVFRFSNYPYSFYRLAKWTHHTLTFCHLCIHLRTFDRRARRKFHVHAFYYFSMNPHILCHQSKRSDQTLQYYLLWINPNIWIHHSIRKSRGLPLVLHENILHIGLHLPTFQLQNHVVYHQTIHQNKKLHLDEDIHLSLLLCHWPTHLRTHLHLNELTFLIH